MIPPCPCCRGGLCLFFDHIAKRAGWYCNFCKRWEDGST